MLSEIQKLKLPPGVPCSLHLLLDRAGKKDPQNGLTYFSRPGNVPADVTNATVQRLMTFRKKLA